LEQRVECQHRKYIIEKIKLGIQGASSALNCIMMSTYPLYDSNFQLYRLSPLYNGPSPILDNLNLHARKLREALKGDSSLSLNAGTILQAGYGTGFGTLKSCVWELLGDEAQWQSAHQDEADDDEISMAGEVSARDARGVRIELEYDKAKQHALILEQPTRKSSISGFTNLPLLLVSMPVPVREIFFRYLTTTFDCRISQMKLRSSFLSSSLERILARETVDIADGESLQSLQLQLSCPSVAPPLKNIDISISKDDLSEFLAHGKKLWQEQSTSTKQSGAISGAFTAALSAYLQQHIALSLDHPGVVVSRFAYGPFTVSSDGKIKVLRSSETAKDFWIRVIEEASGRELDGSTTSTPTDNALREKTTFQATPRQLQLDQLPTDPPPPYELHDPAKQRTGRSYLR
jgi:hypothetical protein